MKRRSSPLWTAAGCFVLAAVLIRACLGQAGAQEVVPPGQGTPEGAAGIEAAPETVYTQWMYTSLDNQGGHAFGQPGNERVTFTGPIEVVFVGDGALEYNHNGDSMLSADCAPAQYGPTFCVENTGSVIKLSVPAGSSKAFYCWGGNCSWWFNDSATRLQNLVCQTLLDGCGPQGNGCYSGVFVTSDWQNMAIWEHQWLGPQGPMGGVHFAEGTFGSAVLAGSCVPASTPTSTATPTPSNTPTASATSTATPSPTVVPPTSTPSPTASPTATATATPTSTPTATPGLWKLWIPLLLKERPLPPPTPTPTADPCPTGYIRASNARGTWHLPLNSAEVQSIGHLPWTSPTTFQVVGDIGPVQWVKYSPSPYQNMVGDSFTYPGGNPGAEFSLYWFSRCGQAHLLDNVDP